jgi:hypothetical protein
MAELPDFARRIDADTMSDADLEFLEQFEVNRYIFIRMAESGAEYAVVASPYNSVRKAREFFERELQLRTSVPSATPSRSQQR